MNQDLQIIARAAREYGLPIASDIEEAEALLVAAEKLNADASDDTPPDVERVTAKTLVKVHDALVDAEVRAEPRRRHATALLTLAEGRVRDAWWHAAPKLMPLFGDIFNDAARIFPEQLAPINGPLDPRISDISPQMAAAVETAHRLDDLAQVRNAYPFTVGPPANVGENGALEPLLRLLTVPDQKTLIQIEMIPHTAGINRWADLVRLGVELAWHSIPEQTALAAQYRENNRTPGRALRAS